MRDINNFIATLVVAMFTLLGALNTGNPESGFVFGMLIVIGLTTISIKVGLNVAVAGMQSKVVHSIGWGGAGLYWMMVFFIVLLPVVVLEGWFAVLLSYLLIVLWNHMHQREEAECTHQ